MTEKIQMRDGDAILIIVKDGRVMHFSSNMALSHAEFVRRTTGALPDAAWVGTVSKINGRVLAMSSKHFYGYQLPAPADVASVVQEKFE